MRKGRTSTVAALASCVLLAAPTAVAAETTRDEYRARAEPICKANAAASEGILAGVRARVRKGELRPAGRQFTRAAAALRRALSELRGVPRPNADEQRLARWLERIADQADLLQRTGRALIAGDRRLAGKLVTRLSTGARLANGLVVPFEFRHCRLEVSQYV